ncbi:MAG: DUF2314 domain-containing protein [Gemmatimonadaceae bacterium]
MTPADALPPVSHPMRTELLLNEPFALDAERIRDALASRGIANSDKTWIRSGDVVTCAIRGGEIRIEQQYAPLPGISDEQLEEAATWWDALGVKNHVNVIEVIVASGEVSAAMVARILVRLTAALIDLTEGSSTDVLGVRVSRTRLLPAAFVQHHARMDPSLGVLVGFHVGDPEQGYVLRSSGLPELGLLNVEVTESDRDLQETAAMMQHWVMQMLTTGAALESETTVGGAGQRVDVRHTPASGGGETVVNLAFAAEQGDVALPPTESVTCPKCLKQVDAEVMHMGFVSILVACPACGEGPVALLEAMVEAAAGGEVTVTLESDDAVLLATLLAEHAPQFDTVVEASDYLREHYDGKRVEVKMPRVLATKMYSDAEDNHPSVRVSSDEALGRMNPTGTMFTSPTADTAMQDAIAAARASIGQFCSRLESPQPGDDAFGVKFPFTDGDEVEHMWISDIRREADEFVGTLEADPQLVRNVVKGSQVRVSAAGISDWAFGNDGSMYGNYTLRVMLPTLPKHMRDALRGRLRPLNVLTP